MNDSDRLDKIETKLDDLIGLMVQLPNIFKSYDSITNSISERVDIASDRLGIVSERVDIVCSRIRINSKDIKALEDTLGRVKEGSV